MNPFDTANDYLFWNAHLSGWAQAVGAVAAILAAAELGRRQFRQAEKLNREQVQHALRLARDEATLARAKELEAERALYEIGRTYCSELKARMDDAWEALSANFDASPESFEAMSAGLLGIPVHQMTHARGARAIVTARGAAGRFLSRHQTVIKRIREARSAPDGIRDRMRGDQSELEGCIADLAACMAFVDDELSAMDGAIREAKAYFAEAT